MLNRLNRLALWWLFGALVLVGAKTTDELIVKLKSGSVRGYSKTLWTKDQVLIYEGIRYGEAPTGVRRFQKPEPAKPWAGVYNATSYRFGCMQPEQVVPDNNVPETGKHSEDCLFLTVYRPKNESATKRPVMMWVHGGGFETGSAFSLAYDASYIVALGDVIVVTINYRLGAFGFLYGATETSPGNLGLHDQILALHWIQQNIEAFGGDRNLVTVFGESAGGMSVASLVLSPLAKGLFKRAIIQSGATNSYLGSESKEKSLIKTKALATSMNCTSQSSDRILECLRKVDAKKIIEATKHARTNGETFEPIWGDSLLPIRPVEALKTGKFNQNLSLMFGVVGNEGALFAESLFPNYLNPNIHNTPMTVEKTKKLIEFMYLFFKETYGKEVANFYTKNLKDSDETELRRAVGYAFGHYHLVCPTVFFGESYGTFNKGINGPVYSYRVVHPPSIPVFKDCTGYMGVCHGDDVMFLFGFPIKLRGIVFTEDDYHLSRDMITEWTRFARTGRPGKIGNKQVEWLPAINISSKNPTVSYMSLDVPSKYKMVDNYYQSACNSFWKDRIFV